jgi:hypothetical protein
MRNRDCIKTPVPRLDGATFSEGSGFATITFPLEGDERDERDKWFFFDNGIWISMKITVAGVRKRLDKGTWECNGDDNFKIVAGGFVYTSDTDIWVRLTTESEPLSPETPTTNTNQSIFPLKKGKSGLEVVQLQNFLNVKGTGEKLVTDGIFGDLTYNKLVKYQEDNNLI